MSWFIAEAKGPLGATHRYVGWKDDQGNGPVSAHITLKDAKPEIHRLRSAAITIETYGQHRLDRTAELTAAMHAMAAKQQALSDQTRIGAVAAHEARQNRQDAAEDR